ncbi:MAG: hypothetical protein IJS29_00640 [Selenomonadaceae bacterium]|nr:hypothetical protein [Selenomonadaceae bacterium]
MRKIKRNKPIQIVQEKPAASTSSWTGMFKNYPRIIGMFILLLFMPPLGWIFAYKFSPYDKRTTIGISIACTAFFVYAVFISPEHEFVDVSKLTRTEFCTRYNEQATKLAPRLGLTIDESKLQLDGENFSYDVTDNLKFSAHIENNFVREVDITATPKNTDDSFQAINCFGLVIATLNPELNQDKRGDVLRELKMLDNALSNDLNETAVRGRITYGVKNSDGKIIFTARVNDDF